LMYFVVAWSQGLETRREIRAIRNYSMCMYAAVARTPFDGCGRW
jgi:hypothetical protein